MEAVINCKPYTLNCLLTSRLPAAGAGARTDLHSAGKGQVCVSGASRGSSISPGIDSTMVHDNWPSPTHVLTSKGSLSIAKSHCHSLCRVCQCKPLPCSWREAVRQPLACSSMAKSTHVLTSKASLYVAKSHCDSQCRVCQYKPIPSSWREAVRQPLAGSSIRQGGGAEQADGEIHIRRAARVVGGD